MRRVLVGGLIGAVVMIAFVVVVDGLMGFKRGINMHQLTNMTDVYTFLSQHVTQPGRYVCNPVVGPDQPFPGHAPVFAVEYSGLGHADARQEVIVGLVVLLLASFAGAWVLANASSRVLARYGSRFLFFAVVGVVLALVSIPGRFGVSAYSLGDAVALAAHDLVLWAVAGLAVAAVVKPAKEQAATTAS